MLARRFAQYVLKSRLHAALWAIIFAVLPYFNWVSAVIVGLVTLRKGAGEGFVVLLWSLLPTVVLVFVTHSWLWLGSRILLGAVLVWLMAVVFLRRPQWRLLILMGALIAAVVVLLFHLFMPDSYAWWVNFLTSNAKQLENSVGMTADQAASANAVASKVAYFATGLNAALFVFASLVQFFFSRMLDKLLPTPIHASNEDVNIRMPRWMVLIAVVVLLLSFFKIRFMLDFLPLALLPFFTAGLISLARALLKRFSPFVVLLIFFVLLLIVMLLPIVAMVLAVYAMIDSLIDFNRGFPGKRRE